MDIIKKVEKRFQGFLESIPDAIVIVSSDGNIQIVNSQTEKLFGYKRDEIVGIKIEKLLPAKHRNEHQAHREFFLENPTARAMGVPGLDLFAQRKDGSEFPVVISLNKIEIEEGIFVLAIIRDITAQKSAEIELKTNEERYRSLLNNLNAGIVVHSSDTSIKESNWMASELLGLSEDQMRGRIAIDPDWKFLNEDGNPLPLEKYPVVQIINTKLSIQNFEAGINRPATNDVVWVIVNGFPVLDNQGELIEIVISFIDITVRKKTEFELKKQTNLLKETQIIAKLGSYTIDVITGNWTASEVLENILGIDADYVKNYEGGQEIIHPDWRKIVHDYFLEVIAGKKTKCEIEYKIIRPNDKVERWVYSAGEFKFDYNNQPTTLVSTVQDITDRKQAEKAIIESQRLNALGEMAASIAHDFNNSLQAMIGNINAARIETKLPDTTLNYFRIIESIITDVGVRVKSLQRFGDTKRESKEYKLINLNSIIEEILLQLHPLWKDNIEKAGRTISIITNYGNLPKIKSNEGELKTSFFNILKNSFEAMPEGGIINIVSGIKNKKVFVTVQDSGIGMNEETKSKIFEPFFTTKGYDLGRGLGMSGVYSIIKHLEGDIFVKATELGKGTTIEIVLPINEQIEIKNETEPNKNLSKIKGPFRVLWVDDDAWIGLSSKIMVESLGHMCDKVSSGKKALEYLNKNNYDLVVSDIGMPEMNGWQLADIINEKFGGKIKIAIVSGWEVDEKEKSAHNIFCTLSKPFSMPDLERLFSQIC